MDREWIAGLMISSLVVAVFFVSCDERYLTPISCVYCEAYANQYELIHEDVYCSDDVQVLENFTHAYVNSFDSQICIVCESDNNLIFYNDCDE